MRPILEVENLSISFLQYDRGARRRVLPAIRRLDLTLEEYLEELRNYPAGGAPFRFSTAEWECALTYLPGGVGEPFRLAGQQGLLCSGDNCGGVVAASWRSTGR